MIRYLEAMVFVLLGAISVWEGFRVSEQARADAVLDVVGPDRYLIGVGALLAILGAAYALRRGSPSTWTGRDAQDEPGSPRLVVLLTLAMAAYSVLIVVIGYAAATLVFLSVGFLLTEVRPLARVLLIALVATAGFAAVFLGLADMPLPTGTAWSFLRPGG